MRALPKPPLLCFEVPSGCFLLFRRKRQHGRDDFDQLLPLCSPGSKRSDSDELGSGKQQLPAAPETNASYVCLKF